MAAEAGLLYRHAGPVLIRATTDPGGLALPGDLDLFGDGDDFPAASPQRVGAMLAELVAQGVMLTGLRAPMTVPDALGHVRSQPGCVALGDTVEETGSIAAAPIPEQLLPWWARFIDTAYLAGEWANAFGDIARPVESTRFARRSAAEARHQKRARRGALSQAALARAALTSGNVDLRARIQPFHTAWQPPATSTSGPASPSRLSAKPN